MLNRTLQLSDLVLELSKCRPLPWAQLTMFPRDEIIAGIELACSNRGTEQNAAAVCAALMNIWHHDIHRTDEMGWCVDFFTKDEILKAVELAQTMNDEREGACHANE